MKFVGLVINISLLFEFDRFSVKSILPVFTRQEKMNLQKFNDQLILLLSCLNSYPARFDVL